MIWLLTALALAADPWMPELESTLARHQAELDLPDAPDIYHLRYHLLTLEQVDAHASFGGLLRRGEDPLNAVAVEMRVGSPSFDNTNFGGWQTGIGSTWLPAELTPHAFQVSAWSLSDSAYKQAVEQFARKEAQFDPPEEYPGDYTLLDEPTVATEAPKTPADADPLVDRAVAVSRALVRSEHTEQAEVFVGHETGVHRIVDSEGSRLVHTVQETTIRALVHVRASDGQLLTDQRLWTVSDPASLPSTEQMTAEAQAMADAVVDLAENAEPLTEEYVGPVIFEDEAAAALFRWLLVPQIEGTPSEIPFDTWLGDIGDANDPVRLGRRVLPLGWTAVDDPTLVPEFPGSSAYDTEGTPTEAVRVVDDGIVKDVLMSRIPRTGTDGSNGHARGMPGDRLKGRASVLTVEPQRVVSERKLNKQAQRLAAAYDRDWVMVVRRFQEPAVLAYGRFAWGDDSSRLPPPVAFYRRYADGHEEPIRGGAFAGVQRYVLRDIVAASAPTTHDFMAANLGDPWFLAPTQGLPTRVVAPEVLVGEMEIVPTPGDPREKHELPPPPLAKNP